MTPRPETVVRRPFIKGPAWPVLLVVSVWGACTLIYNNAWRFLDPSLHRPLAVFCVVMMGLLIVFGATLIYPATFFRGASWRERVMACLITPFLWIVKELFMMPDCYSLAEKLFYAINPLFLGAIFLTVLQMGLAEIVCRVMAKRKFRSYTGQVFGAAPIMAIIVSMIALYFFNVWGNRVGYWYVHQGLYQDLFMR
ncbi:MAG: hypothetical protein V1816_25485 [Pseudomonadota bacterium]